MASLGVKSPSSFIVKGVRKVVPEESKPSPKPKQRHITKDMVQSAKQGDIRRISNQVDIGGNVKIASKDDIEHSGIAILQGGGENYKAITKRKELVAELEAKAGRLQIETMFIQEKLDALHEDKEV